MLIKQNIKNWRTYHAAALAVLFSLAFSGLASANATNISETNYGVGTATTSCNSNISMMFDVPYAGDWVIVNMGAKTSTPVSTPTDSFGDQFTLLSSTVVSKGSAAAWSGVWMTKTSTAGQVTVSWPCDGAAMSGGLVGEFTSNGPTHGLSVDTSGTSTWLSSPSATVTASSATQMGGDLVIVSGYTDNQVIPYGPNTSILGYKSVQSNGNKNSGTQFSGFNVGTNTKTWALGSTPTDSVNFSKINACNPLCTPVNSDGTEEIIALYAN